MNKTQHYQLNQWDPEDRVLRVDFNADNAAIEAALKANAEAVSSEAAARAAADTAVRGEFAAADASIRADFAAADTTIRNSVTSEANTRSAQDAAIRKEFAAADANVAAQNCMVKLMDTTTTSATTQINLNVASLKLHEYAYVVIVPRIGFASSATQTIRLRLNNLSSSIYIVKGTSTPYGPSFYPSSGWGSGETAGNSSTIITLTASMPNIIARADYTYGYCLSDACVISSASLANNAISTINFFARDTTLAAGARIVIYGVKW